MLRSISASPPLDVAGRLPLPLSAPLTSWLSIATCSRSHAKDRVKESIASIAKSRLSPCRQLRASWAACSGVVGNPGGIGDSVEFVPVAIFHCLCCGQANLLVALHDPL